MRSWQEELAAGNPRLIANEFQADGDTVRWTGSLAVDFFRNLGLEVVEGQWVISVEEGRIATFSFSLAPDDLARVRAATQKG